MKPTCRIFFHLNLNDFLPVLNKSQWISYPIQPGGGVKDAIEALGVPHVEVDQISVNGTIVPFTYRLAGGDTIEVYPFTHLHLFPPTSGFILDVHLGKLARLLRMLGMDTWYEKTYADKEIAHLAAQTNRVVLTRDVGLLKHKIIHNGYWLRSQYPEEQIQEVIGRFLLCRHINPFSRCISCNGDLQSVTKSAVQNLLLPDTQQTFQAFIQCKSCGKVFWKGSHFEKMKTKIHRILSVHCQ